MKTHLINNRWEKMGHAVLWNSHPKNFGPDSWTWYEFLLIDLSIDSFILFPYSVTLAFLFDSIPFCLSSFSDFVISKQKI